MSDLPDGWEWAAFKDVAHIASDLVDPSAYPDSIHVAPNHIEPHTGRLLPARTVREDGVTSPKHRFFSGQILYSKIRPYLGKVTAAKFDGLCSADMYPVVAKVDPEFLLFLMLSDDFTEAAARHQGRSVLPKINQVALKTIQTPVAPIAEQRRIVAAIEEAFSKLDAGEAYLRAAHRRLTRMRETVVANAISGGPLCSDGLVDPENISGTIPSGWSWSTLGDLAWDSGYGTSVKCAYDSDGPAVLRIPNIQHGRINLDDLKNAPSDLALNPELFVREGDLLIVRTNGSRDLIGRSAPGRSGVKATFASYLIRFRMREEMASSDFVSLVLRARPWRSYLERAAGSSAGQYNLSLRALAPMPVLVPPLNEQYRIVQEVERQFSFIDACERAVNAGLQHSAALRRSILKAAFEGKLVPQDPNDEPASVLLERIRAERAATEKPKKAKRATKKSANASADA